MAPTGPPGDEACARALAADAATAEGLYRDAREHLERTLFRTEVARAHLLYGEWLRRENRRVDARAHLRAAHECLCRSKWRLFAERAGRELAAMGEMVRRRTVETRDDLSAQGRQIVQLVCEGLSNPAIGARLFLSPRTEEWHLHKVYDKVGVRSRRELAPALPTGQAEKDADLPLAAEAAVEERADVVGEQLGVLVQEAVAGVRGRCAAARWAGARASRWLFSVIIIVSLSPLATNTGWVIAARRASFEGSGIPQRVIASSWASRAARSVGSSRSIVRAEIRAKYVHALRPALVGA